ncbi:MAG TPA: NADH-quinone oxidoreductase subunit C, partial [Pusillimonas sp.]|nr:NADH-quinone oxidoreductase subunit C [Pusillimonas sp.]
MTRLETLKNHLQTQFAQNCSLKEALNELTLDVPAGQWVDVCTALRDTPALSFELCIDLCGVDYATYGE